MSKQIITKQDHQKEHRSNGRGMDTSVFYLPDKLFVRRINISPRSEIVFADIYFLIAFHGFISGPRSRPSLTAFSFATYPNRDTGAMDE